MPGLRELQRRIVGAVFDDKREQLSSLLQPARGLDVYRSSVFTRLGEALESIYPVTMRLVGEAYFRQGAGDYVRRFPSHTGNVQDYGEGFADYLAELPELAALPYLPDVARLELACHRVFHAGEATPVSLDAFAAIAPSRYASLCLRLHPATMFLESPYPVHRIWAANQADGEVETVHLEEGGVHLLISRRGSEVELLPLGEGEYAFLNELSAGQSLAEAYRTAAAHAQFDLTACLVRHAARGLWVGLQEDNPK